MLVPSLKGIVGPVVLPILGAVPDGAIVIFSGLGPIADAQAQVICPNPLINLYVDSRCRC